MERFLPAPGRLDSSCGPVLASGGFKGVGLRPTHSIMTDFILDLATLKPTLNRVEVEAPAREVGLPEAEWPGSVQGDLRVEKSGTRVSVRGTVSSVARLECVRCLRAFDHRVTAELTVFAEQSGSSSRSEQDALERDDYMLFHDGRRLDLRETVRESLLLELPITPHCREECRGLCPKCGADLNEGPCGCAA